MQGNWTFTLSDEHTHCTGAAGGGDIKVHLADTAPGDIVNYVDTWEFGDVTGQVVLSTGHFELVIWKGVGQNGGLLTGTIHPDLSFTGTLQDPDPGFGAIFVSGACLFDVTGSHD